MNFSNYKIPLYIDNIYVLELSFMLLLKDR